MEQTFEDFEFDAPQFTDFTAMQEAIDPISEEVCNAYFDKKTEEIRKSQEWKRTKKELDNKENNEPSHEHPSNLLSVSFTSNTSDISMKSCSTNRSNQLQNLSRLSNKAIPSRTQLSTEELELQKLELQKEELKKIKVQNARHVARMNDDQYVFHPARSTKLTIPISPAFATLKRAEKRKKSDRQRRQSAAPVSERKNKNKQVLKPKNPTKTIPKSFKLSTKTRRRRRKTELNTEQKQMKEIEKRGTFKAKKLNPKMFKANALGSGILNNIKNKAAKNTKQIPFTFRTDQRAKKHNAATSND